MEFNLDQYIDKAYEELTKKQNDLFEIDYRFV